MNDEIRFNKYEGFLNTPMFIILNIEKHARRELLLECRMDLYPKGLE